MPFKQNTLPTYHILPISATVFIAKLDKSTPLRLNYVCGMIKVKIFRGYKMQEQTAGSRIL